MKDHPLLVAYRMAWTAALPGIRALAAADRALARLRRHGRAGRHRSGDDPRMDKGFLPRNWRVTERVEVQCASAREKTLWLHGASLGEAKGVWALACELAATGRAVVVTATTAEGFDFLHDRCMENSMKPFESGSSGESVSRSKSPGLIRVSIAPLDHPALLKRFLDHHKIEGLCLYEAELWPNALRVCAGREIPVLLVSARLTPKALKLYRRFPALWKGLFDSIRWIQAQSPEDGESFRRLMRKEVSVGFDFKAAHFLRIPAVTYHASYLSGESSGLHGGPKEAGIFRGNLKFAFVSLHFEELQWLMPELEGFSRRFDLVVLPRRMGELARFRAALEPLGFALLSRDPKSRHVLVDSFGKVEAVLADCHSAFIGGSLISLGCHNLWEPLLAGLKIYFGPWHANQALAKPLLERGIAEVILAPSQLRALRRPGAEIAEACRATVEAYRESMEGALADFRERIFAIFPGNKTESRP